MTQGSGVRGVSGVKGARGVRGLEPRSVGCTAVERGDDEEAHVGEVEDKDLLAEGAHRHIVVAHAGEREQREAEGAAGEQVQLAFPHKGPHVGLVRGRRARG